tara:strand:+ start:3567 stop:6107 length:2541 start_codon:yes stop_codon:yes gene_type:complete
MEVRRGMKQQRLSYSKKKKDNFQWGKDNIDAIDSASTYSELEIREMLLNYREYNNEIDQENFDKVCNPFGIEGEDYKDIIQPYNKTYNKINVLLGEEWKRPYNYKSAMVNSEVVDEYDRKKSSLLKAYVQAEFESEKEKMLAQITAQAEGKKLKPEELEEMAQAQMDGVMPPEKIESYMKTNWRAGSEIAADQLLQYYSKSLDLKKKKNTAFKHALIAGQERVWVGVIGGQPYIEVLNPVKAFGHKSPEVEYVQDGVYAGYRTKMTVADILDRYYEDLTDAEKSRLDVENSFEGGLGIRNDLIGKEYNNKGLNKSEDFVFDKDGDSLPGSYGGSGDGDVDVVHVEWKSQRKIGFKTYYEEGEEQLTMVDETFKIPEGATKVKYKDANGTSKTKYVFEAIDGTPCEIEWGWIPEVWEGTKIDEDIYVNIRPKSFQYRSVENPYKVRLGYYGLNYNAMNAKGVSTMGRMRPFYYLWLVVMHKMTEILAADKPPLINIDMTMIPKKLSTEQYMYYNKLGINFYDPNQNNDAGLSAGQKGPSFETQRGTVQHVTNYINILNSLDEQIGEAAGVTRQREGQTSQYESVSGNQSAIIQSSHITETLFLAHNLLWKEVLTGFLETILMLYRDDEIKLPFVLDDMTRGVIKTNSETFLNAEMGIFITDDFKDHDALTKMTGLSLEMLQNGVPASDVMSLYRSTSAESWERQMKEYESLKAKTEQNMQEMQAQQAEKTLKLEIDSREDVQQHESDMIDKEYGWKQEIAREAALIGGMAKNAENDLDNDGVPDAFEVFKFGKEAEFKMAEQALKEKQMAQDKEGKNQDVKIKEKEIASKEKIEIKKAQAAKNKPAK